MKRKSAFHPSPQWQSVEGFVEHRQTRDFGALCILALQSKVTWIPVVCICTGKEKYFYYLFYYLLYELLLFTWKFCLLLQVWNYLLLLGICALFKKQALFFFIMDKMLRWQEVISIWLSKIFIVPFILCTRFLGLFFPLMSQCWVQHVSAISFVRLFKTKFVLVSSYKNKLDI